MNNQKQVTLEDALRIAQHHHQQGNLTIAEQTYKDILNAAPDNHMALHQLGVICYQLRKFEQGLPYLQKAIEISPDAAYSWNTYGVMLGELGRHAEAIEKWKEAIRIKPDFFEVYSNLGNTYWILKRYDEARDISKKAVDIKPDFADGYINYGNAVNSLGDSEGAIEIWKKALDYNPNHAFAYTNIGNALRDLGRLKESEEYCRKGLEIHPDNPVGYNNLANALSDQSKMDEAVRHYKKAIELNPHYIDAHNNLAQAYSGLLQYEDAAGSARFAIAFDPNNETAHSILSNALRELGKLKEAEQVARKALSLHPMSVEAKIDLANILLLSDRYEEAELFYKQAAEDIPDRPHIYLKMAAVQERANHFDDALVSLDKALELSPEMPEIFMRRGMVYLLQNKMDECLECLEKALEMRPDFIQALVSYSEALQTKGDMDKARDVCIRGFEKDPQNPGLFYTFSKIHKFSADDDYYINLQLLTARAETLPKHLQISLYFALSKAEQDIKNSAESFAALKKGCDIKYSTVVSDRKQQADMHDKIIQTCNQDFFKPYEGKGLDTDIPVFIVGMPRSGTTLTEQIISSHPDVFGAGELVFMATVEEKIGPLSPENIRDHASLYLELAQGLHPDAKSAKRITDKMPGNYMRLAQIVTAFPKAKIIHCRRDPMDTMLSCYKQLFARGHYWSYNLDEMAEHYAHYERLMAHWRDVLTDRFIEIDYEETVNDFENQARRLVDYVGLEWNEACLSPHKSERAILTASKGQVRQPIYKSSVEAWRRFEKELQSLADALEKYRNLTKKAAA